MSSRLAIDGGPMAVRTFTDAFDWPRLTEEDEQAALEVLRRGTMSESDVTEAFETEFADWQGRSFALGYNSGTAAMWGAMYGVGVGAGDEVIAPSVAWWSAVVPCMGLGATPVFADIDPESLCLDPRSFAERITDRTAAVVVIHNHGHPADIDSILEIAAEHDVAVIEDVAHAPGGTYRGERVGNFGDAALFSFQSWKPLAAGEGGMLVTDGRDVFERAVAFSHYDRHEELLTDPDLAAFAGIPFGGQRHTMHQVSAAVGRGQLARYDDQMAEIQRSMHYFWDQLADVPGIEAHRTDDAEATMGGWFLPKGHYDPAELGDVPVERFAEAVRAEGSVCRPGDNEVLHVHPLFSDADIYGHGEPTRLANADRDVRESPDALPVAERVQERCMSVPWFRQYRPDVIDQHASAYRKVATNADRL